ncbi:hypothetical protein Efla_006201 [Eimeria flavescens]
MVNHSWPAEGLPPQQLPERLLPQASTSSSSSSSRAAPAAPVDTAAASLPPWYTRLPPHSLLLLCLLLLLVAGASVASAATQQQQQQQREEAHQIMPPTLTELGPLASDDSTEASDAVTAGDSAAAKPRFGICCSGEEIKADQEMCAWMFDTLIAFFEHRPEPTPPASVLAMHKRGVQTPAFVTWMKRRPGREGFGEEDVDLRGCIGSLSPIPILKLKDYALISAFEDSRFLPVTLKEIPDLKCHVSLLHSFEPGENAFDWVVGKHGLIINFMGRSRFGPRKYQATYLPEVAAETGMTKEQTLTSLVRKAGYTGGPVGPPMFERLSLTRYQSSQARLSYDEYKKRFQ